MIILSIHGFFDFFLEFITFLALIFLTVGVFTFLIILPEIFEGFFEESMKRYKGFKKRYKWHHERYDCSYFNRNKNLYVKPIITWYKSDNRKPKDWTNIRLRLIHNKMPIINTEEYSEVKKFNKHGIKLENGEKIKYCQVEWKHINKWWKINMEKLIKLQTRNRKQH